MRRNHKVMFIGAILLALAASVTSSAGGQGTGFAAPPNARPYGHSLVDLSSAYVLWGFGTAAEVNPLVAARCERSPIHPKVWFLPVAFGGESEAVCHVPPGTWLVATAGFIECSNIEPEPFYGADEQALMDCTEEWFALLNRADVILDGAPLEDLDQYVVTTRPVTLPPNNLISPDSGLSLSKGYFLVIPPLSRGTHTLRLYDEFEALGFKAGLTIKVVVG